jgi:hypothetical protein
MKKPTEPANAEMLLEEYGEVVEKTYTVLLTGLNQAKPHMVGTQLFSLTKVA